MNISDLSESLVTFQTSQGIKARAVLTRLGRLRAVFEVHGTVPVLRLSEVLNDLAIKLNGRALYSGKAVVGNLLDCGTNCLCEVKLEEPGVSRALLSSNGQLSQSVTSSFTAFMHEWEKLYRLRPEFKAVISDMQTYLTELRLWLGQVELEIGMTAAPERDRLEKRVLDELTAPIVSAIDHFIERFESLAAGLDPVRQPAHQSFLRRQLHPLLLCSPFAHRAYHKPLGYAGDYEMVNMMFRSPYEGDSLFAMIINAWLLGQLPVRAHRNRVEYLNRTLTGEVLRLKAAGNTAHVFNLGCGPAEEVKRFLLQDALSGAVELTLVDFNEETLAELAAELRAVKRRSRVQARLHLVKKSVNQLLKDHHPATAAKSRQSYDFVYCAGLFDYLTDPVCKRLMNIFYDMLAPGGLLLATNVSAALNGSYPFRHSMDYLLDWQLAYRDGPQFAALRPDAVPPQNASVIADQTGVNLFLHVRKPSHD